MVRCPVCGAWMQGGTGRGGFHRCPICGAKLRVITTHASARALLVCALFLATAVLLAANMIWFFFWPYFLLTFSIRRHFTKVEAVPERTFPTPQTSQTGNEQTSPPLTQRREVVPAVKTSSAHASPTWRYCIYCGAMINESNWRFCANCGASLPASNRTNDLDDDNFARAEDQRAKCMVCGVLINNSDRVAYCKHCGNVAHRTHLLEWIHVKGRCPRCDLRLSEEDIE